MSRYIMNLHTNDIQTIDLPINNLLMVSDIYNPDNISKVTVTITNSKV